jgi:hypothetical protein
MFITHACESWAESGQALETHRHRKFVPPKIAA